MVTCLSRGQVFVTWSSDRYVFKFLSHDHVVTLYTSVTCSNLMEII